MILPENNFFCKPLSQMCATYATSMLSVSPSVSATNVITGSHKIRPTDNLCNSMTDRKGWGQFVNIYSFDQNI